MGGRLRYTLVGEAIQDYLRCIDFCKEGEKLLSFGSEATPYLLYILDRGLPEGPSRRFYPVYGPTEVRIVNALGMIGDERALERLLSLTDHSYEHVRSALPGALVKIDDGDDVLGALKLLLEDPSFYVRVKAAVALGELGRDDAIPFMKESLKTQPSKSVQEELKKAIEEIERR